MSCNRGKASPDSHTKLRLFADSAGYCQNPDCLQNLFLSIGDNDFHIAEMAHVFSASDDGPRADQNFSNAERGDYKNLILLCPTCHTIIDKAENHYTDLLITSWKVNHKNEIDKIFSIKAYPERKFVYQDLQKTFRENQAIFETYGPLTDERYNPESVYPKLWHRKIHASILPNNRKILNIIDKNYSLLLNDEYKMVELYRQHVDDFEAKHIGNSESSGTQFPQLILNIFKPKQ